MRRQEQRRKKKEEAEEDSKEEESNGPLENKRFQNSDSVKIFKNDTAEDSVLRKASLFDLDVFFSKKQRPKQKTSTLLQKDSVKSVKIPATPTIKLKSIRKDTTNQSEELIVTEVDPDDVKEESISKISGQKNLKGNQANQRSEIPVVEESTAKRPQQKMPKSVRKRNVKLDTMIVFQMKDSVQAYFDQYPYKKRSAITTALSKVKNVRNGIRSVNRRVQSDKKNIDKYTVEKYKKYSQAFACIVMFLIGAPLGSIIKKGGLGVPVIVSIFFF
ncbi:MAG: LptF/LptG family permease, partial [Bacteroidota bacterium]